MKQIQHSRAVLVAAWRDWADREIQPEFFCTFTQRAWAGRLGVGDFYKFLDRAKSRVDRKFGSEARTDFKYYGSVEETMLEVPHLHVLLNTHGQLTKREVFDSWVQGNEQHRIGVYGSRDRQELGQIGFDEARSDSRSKTQDVQVYDRSKAGAWYVIKTAGLIVEPSSLDWHTNTSAAGELFSHFETRRFRKQSRNIYNIHI